MGGFGGNLGAENEGGAPPEAPTPIPIQLEQLRGSLYATAPDEPEPERLEENFRAPQDLNQRLVLASFSSGEGDGVG